MHITKAEIKGQTKELRSSALFVKNKHKHPLIVAEIGVCNGVNALAMVTHMKIGMLYLIDPYTLYTGGISVNYNSQAFQDNAYANSFLRLLLFHRFVTYVTRSSLFASTLFPDKLFDYVYIDGNHTYEAVKEDCNAWWIKIKSRGVMGGHDYFENNTDEVKRAVDEFVLENKLKLTVTKDTDWWIEKE